MDGKKQRIKTMDELRRELAESDHGDALRRFDEALNRGNKLEAMLIAKQNGVAIYD